MPEFLTWAQCCALIEQLGYYRTDPDSIFITSGVTPGPKGFTLEAGELDMISAAGLRQFLEFVGVDPDAVARVFASLPDDERWPPPSRL